MNTPTKQLTLAIILGLVAWGIYLAIGATGIFVQSSMLDTRKSVIVIVSMTLFLGLWAMVLASRNSAVSRSKSELEEVQNAERDREGASPDTSRSTTTGAWSKPGIATLLCGAAGALCWFVAILTWQSVSMTGTTVLGWLAALFIMASATSGMISLSNPRVMRGKWLGLLGLIGFVGSFIGFIARMSR